MRPENEVRNETKHLEIVHISADNMLEAMRDS